MTPTWRKSSHSGAIGNCVELAVTPDVLLVRDSKNPIGSQLRLPESALSALVSLAR
jgi:hypothetical protein